MKKQQPGLLIGHGTHLKTREKVFPIILPDANRSGHTLICGTTRCGKTRLIESMVRQDIRSGKSVAVIDPKGDIPLLSSIVEEAYACGREHELMLFSPLWPDYSCHLDPLRHYRMPEELVNHITSGVSSGKGDDFFANVAYEISLAITLAKILIAKDRGERTTFNLNEVMECVSQDAISVLLNEISVIETNEARQVAAILEKIMKSPPDYFGKISSSLRVALVELCAGNIGRLVGNAGENGFIERLESGQKVILVAQLGALVTQKAALTSGKLIISMIKALAGRIFSNDRKLKSPLCVYVDEAQSTIYPGFEDLLAKAAGAGIYTHLAVQSIKQIENVLSDKAACEAILSNCNTKIFFRVPDPETAKYVVEHFGVRTNYTPMINVSSSDLTFRETEEEVLRHDEVLNLQPRQVFMMTYTGNFQALTASVPDTKTIVQFPDI